MVPDAEIDTPEDWIVRRRRSRIVLTAVGGVARDVSLDVPRGAVHCRPTARQREGQLS